MRSLFIASAFLFFVTWQSQSATALTPIIEDADQSAGLIPDGCLPMSEISSMVFQQSMTQNRRRSSNVPSLQCIGNCPADAPILTQAHCTRQGSDDYGRPTWRCIPQFGTNDSGESSERGQQYGLGTIRVECEGCEKKGDANIVRGSCSLKYSITTSGHSKSHRKYPRHQHGTHHPQDDIIVVLIWFIFGITTIAATVAICRSCRTQAYQTNAKNEYVTDANGNVYGAPMYSNGNGAVHHHYGGGGGGFGTGMLTGYIMGDVISRAHRPYGGYGYGYEGTVAEYAGGFDGTEGGGFDSAGWGGTDSI